MEGHMAQRGRPKKTEKPETVTRSVTFPADLYEQVRDIATREERDVTSQIVKALRDLVARYQREQESGPMELVDVTV
jgi:hypothetical protein